MGWRLLDPSYSLGVAASSLAVFAWPNTKQRHKAVAVPGAEVETLVLTRKYVSARMAGA